MTDRLAHFGEHSIVRSRPAFGVLLLALLVSPVQPVQAAAADEPDRTGSYAAVVA